MNYYTNHQEMYKNRAERRKNEIKTEKMLKCKYTKEQLEKVLKKELTDLINEPYTEALKRERYKRLEPLIKEYQRQKGQAQMNENKQKKVEMKDSNIVIREYNRQKEELKNNVVYRKLTDNNNTKIYSQAGSSNTKMKRAIASYETQVAFSKNSVSVKKQTTKTVNTNLENSKKKVAKKGFWERVVDFFKKPERDKKAQNSIAISKPKVPEKKVVYTVSTQMKAKKNEIYNEFEKALRNFENYSKENTAYQYMRNGRVVRCQPRYL